MKRALTWIAILLMLIGIVGIGAAIYTNITFGMHGVTIAEWETALEAQQGAADKVGKMVKSLRSSYDKWKVDSEEWTERGKGLMTAAENSAEAIFAGTGGAEAWNEAYAAWQTAVAEMNASDDPALDGVKKAVKSLNRTTKSVDGAMQDWAQHGELIQRVGVQSGSLFALCIAYRNLLLMGGIVLLLVGFFMLPAVRDAIASSHQLVGYLFVLPALLFLLVFAVTLKWFPIGFSSPIGVLSEDVTLAQRLHHLALPAFTLSLMSFSNIALHTRQKLVDVLSSEYVLFARARGEGRWSILRRHGLRNIMLPALTLQFASFAELFGGSVMAENVFSYAGLGTAVSAAGLNSDMPLLLGVTLFSALFVCVGNMIANLLYGVVDPQIREVGK